MRQENGAACAAVSEWLRSWTRNPMGFARTGSNPVRSVSFSFFSFLFFYLWIFISVPPLHRNKEECLHLFIWCCLKQYLVLYIRGKWYSRPRLSITTERCNSSLTSCHCSFRSVSFTDWQQNTYAAPNIKNKVWRFTGFCSQPVQMKISRSVTQMCTFLLADGSEISSQFWPYQLPNSKTRTLTSLALKSSNGRNLQSPISCPNKLTPIPLFSSIDRDEWMDGWMDRFV